MAIEDLPADYFSGGSHLTEAGATGLRAKLTEIIGEANAVLAQLDAASSSATPNTLVRRNASGDLFATTTRTLEIKPLTDTVSGQQPEDLYAGGAPTHADDVGHQHHGNIIWRTGIGGETTECAQFAATYGHTGAVPSMPEGVWPSWEMGHNVTPGHDPRFQKSGTPTLTFSASGKTRNCES